MSGAKPKVVDIRSGQEAETRTLCLPEATVMRLAEQILICARDVRDEGGLFTNAYYVKAAFERAPRVALDAVSRITGANIVMLDRTIHLKGGLAPIHERPSAFRNDRKRHEK
jgi:hypothetical protein